MIVKLTALYMNPWSSNCQATDPYNKKPALSNLHSNYCRKIPLIGVYEPHSTFM